VEDRVGGKTRKELVRLARWQGVQKEWAGMNEWKSQEAIKLEETELNNEQTQKEKSHQSFITTKTESETSWWKGLANAVPPKKPQSPACLNILVQGREKNNVPKSSGPGAWYLSLHGTFHNSVLEEMEEMVHKQMG
jgi:hypothetical protein